MNIAIRSSGLAALNWYDDAKMVALVKRTAARDCNIDEFDQFIAVARDLRLNPLRKQIYAFVFNKEEEKKRNMVIVIAIDGMRSISARNGLYRPDNKPPRYTIDPAVANADSNPLGLVAAEVSIFTGNKLRGADGSETIEWNEVVGQAYWDEFAPIKELASEDDYDWVDTGETWPDSGKPKKKKKLRSGADVRLRLDPKKEGWRKSGRHMLAKCAEAIAHRKANPEALSAVFADEEIDRARFLDDVEYREMSPSEMAAKGEADKRQELLGGPAILVSLTESGVLDRVPVGQFADKIMGATQALSAEQAASFCIRNRVALQEFWAHNKTDALALKQVLEQRSKPSPSAAPRSQETADPAPSAPAASAASGGAGDPIDQVGWGPSAQAKTKEKLEATLLAEIEAKESMLGCLQFGRDMEDRMVTLDKEAKARIRVAFEAKQATFKSGKK